MNDSIVTFQFTTPSGGTSKPYPAQWDPLRNSWVQSAEFNEDMARSVGASAHEMSKYRAPPAQIGTAHGNGRGSYHFPALLNSVRKLGAYTMGTTSLD